MKVRVTFKLPYKSFHSGVRSLLSKHKPILDYVLKHFRSSYE